MAAFRVFEGKYEGVVSANDVDGNDTNTSNNPQDVIVDGLRPFFHGFLFNIDDSSFGYAFEETSNGLEIIGNLNQDHPFLSRVNKQGPDEPVEIFLGIPPIPTTFDFSLTYVKANPNAKTNLTVDNTLLIENGKEKEIINDNSISGIELSKNTRPGLPDNNNQPGIFNRPDIVVTQVRDEDGDILGISNQGAESIDQDQLPRVFKLSGIDQANTPTDGTPSTLGIRNENGTFPQNSTNFDSTLEIIVHVDIERPGATANSNNYQQSQSYNAYGDSTKDSVKLNLTDNGNRQFWGDTQPGRVLVMTDGDTVGNRSISLPTNSYESNSDLEVHADNSIFVALMDGGNLLNAYYWEKVAGSWERQYLKQRLA